MSLQRIIELARRQGMPIIMTDVGGREPMVLLSLDDYEEMLDGGKDRVSSHEQPAPNTPIMSVPGSVPPPSVSPSPQPQKDGLRMRQRDEDRTQALHRSLETVSREVAAPISPQTGGGEGMVLEERFSFQP